MSEFLLWYDCGPDLAVGCVYLHAPLLSTGTWRASWGHTFALRLHLGKNLDPQTLCQDPCMIIYNTCGVCIFWGSTSTHAHTFYLCSNGGEYDTKSTLHAHIQKPFFRWSTHRSNWIFCCIRIHSLGLVLFAWKISLRECKGLDMSTTDLCWMYIPYNNSRTQT